MTTERKEIGTCRKGFSDTQDLPINLHLITEQKAITRSHKIIP